MLSKFKIMFKLFGVVKYWQKSFDELCSYGSGVEHFLGKEEVVGSSPTMSSRKSFGQNFNIKKV